MISERQHDQFVGKSLKTAKKTINRRDVVNRLGVDRKNELEEYIDRCVPVFPINNVVDLSLIDVDEFPITAVEVDNNGESEGHTYSVDRDSLFTSIQKPLVYEGIKNYTDTKSNPVPANESIRLIHDTFMSEQANNAEIGKIYPALNGKTFAVRATNFVVELLDEPTDFTYIMARPALMFPFEDQKVDPDIVCHELTHAKQKEVSPFRVIESQAAADMASFGEELEAYFVGGAIRRAISNITDERYKALGFPKGNPSMKLFQLKVDSVREEHCDPEDPLRPSKELLSRYEGYGVARQGMLSSKVNFAKVLEGMSQVVQQNRAHMAKNQ